MGFKDRTGQHIGQFAAISYVRSTHHGAFWLVKCRDCGVEKELQIRGRLGDRLACSACSRRRRKDVGQKRAPYCIVGNSKHGLLGREDPRAYRSWYATAAIIRITRPAKSTTNRRPSPPAHRQSLVGLRRGAATRQLQPRSWPRVHTPPCIGS
jgi:hypothetical protein